MPRTPCQYLQEMRDRHDGYSEGRIPVTDDEEYGRVEDQPREEDASFRSESKTQTLNRTVNSEKIRNDLGSCAKNRPARPISVISIGGTLPLVSSGRTYKTYQPSSKTMLFKGSSGLYSLLLVAICIVILVTEVSANNVPLHFFEGFFTFLYIFSLLFMLYVSSYLLREANCGGSHQATEGNSSYFQMHRYGSYTISLPNSALDVRRISLDSWNLPRCSHPENQSIQDKKTGFKRPSKYKTSENELSHGSFFLRIGAITFGLGTMIYCGLEFGTYFEIPWTSPCHKILRGVNPPLQMLFTFTQMYFVFMNAKLNIQKFKFIARFGLMHVFATNLCVWMKTLFDESTKELYYPWDDGVVNNGTGIQGDDERKRAVANESCERNPVVGDILRLASPYLFPIVIEHSLISATIIFSMWKKIGKNPRFRGNDDDYMSVSSRKVCAFVKTDCIGASKGLFLGLLTLISGLICLLLFFVLTKHHQEEVVHFAIFLADSSHFFILLTATIATIIGLIRIQKLKFHGEVQSSLTDLLLRISATGIFVYSGFSIVSGLLADPFQLKNILTVAVGGATIIQAILQLLLISDARRRRNSLTLHNTSKPGRQVITFLIVTNLTMWIFYTFEFQKVRQNPVQSVLFGFFAWTIIQRAAIPLCIFFRFYSTVILVEIWKNSYKTKVVD